MIQPIKCLLFLHKDHSSRQVEARTDGNGVTGTPGRAGKLQDMTETLKSHSCAKLHSGRAENVSEISSGSDFLVESELWRSTVRLIAGEEASWNAG